MLIIRNHSKIPEHLQGCVVALGNFDGLHIGHQKVIDTAIAIAKNSGKPAAVLTFEPHPRRLFNPSLPPLRITSLRSKIKLLQDNGVDFIRIVRFNKQFANLSPENFIKDILCQELQVSHVVTGDDFVFGNKRLGNVDYLKEMSVKLGFAATICEQVNIDGERCSSTRIRSLLELGKVGEIKHLLGREYSISGRVIAGDKRGRTIGFPTANILPNRIFLPAQGVYAVIAKIAGQLVKGVANIGTRPTFAGSHVLLEVHLFDFEQEIYGEHVEISLIEHIRAEQKFAGFEELKTQITADCRSAKEILSGAAI
ncbi:MAG: bifunctional riboflavin kinase/FAD synthetase [Pseudomonadota bacterium]